MNKWKRIRPYVAFCAIALAVGGASSFATRAGMADFDLLVKPPAAPTCRLDNQPYDAGSDATQHYVIDGFILSPNVELTSVQTQDDGFRFSDHNPVLLNIRLK